jgi:hypothetical protein
MLKASGYLPNDPAGQKSTGHKQGASTQREQRSAARRGERCRRSGSAATGRSGAAATGRSGAAATGRSGNGHSGGATVNVVVDATEAGVNLSLGDTKLLGDLSNGLSVSGASNVASRSVSVSTGVATVTTAASRCAGGTKSSSPDSLTSEGAGRRVLSVLRVGRGCGRSERAGRGCSRSAALTLRSCRGLNLRTVNVLDVYVPTNRLGQDGAAVSTIASMAANNITFLNIIASPFSA